ncbi:hypothetical protein CPB84DRAFT_1841352 [Gymnopilus junonius]|uniref:Carbohydrate-binding module family 19 domain-containing protein n=1 Tax=Gymnopilus junonius TaxID=109634 RepID=A0A9P5TU95_GYMJU|nr:hypothetical protein CPB84DRAFT_1841352 [Gymnopilus junonius]
MQIMFVTVGLALAASALSLQQTRGGRRATGFALQNGEDAISLNQKFKTLNTNSLCTEGENACVNDQFAQCVGGKFVLEGCGAGAICAALPLVNSPGTSITCTTEADLAQRIAATGAQTNSTTQMPSTTTSAATGSASTTIKGKQGGNNNGNDNGDNSQTSLTLNPDVIAPGFANNGQDVPAAGQIPSLTSTNNFINFCKSVNLPLTNGAQVVNGSCNPAPMGVIPAKAKMPSSKFVFPKNGATIAANKTFTIKMAIRNLATGNFVNADENYFSAPQQLNGHGLILGHSHVVIEELDALNQTTPSDPTVFAFFKGLNAAAQDGSLTADVDKGLPAGFYKLSSINTASNHQPVLAPVAQHGSLDDAVYFTVA